jgi:hypothetical protein
MTGVSRKKVATIAVAIPTKKPMLRSMSPMLIITICAIDAMDYAAALA